MPAKLGLRGHSRTHLGGLLRVHGGKLGLERLVVNLQAGGLRLGLGALCLRGERGLNAGDLLGVGAGHLQLDVLDIGRRSHAGDLALGVGVGRDEACVCRRRLAGALGLGSRRLLGLLAGGLLSRRDDGHGAGLCRDVEVAAEIDGDVADVHAEQVVDLVLEHECGDEAVGDAGDGDLRRDAFDGERPRARRLS